MDGLSREEIARGEFHCHRIKRHIFSTASCYHRIEIVETESYGRGLFLDGRLQHLEADEYIYSESMVHPAMLLLGGRARRILCIGGGPGGIVRELLKHRSVERVVQVEIDDVMVDASKDHLAHITSGAWDDPRVALIIDNAIHFLERRKEVFDLIISDASEPVAGSPARRLFSAETIAAIRANLHPLHGIFVTWAGSASLMAIAPAARIVRTVADGFPHSAAYLSHPQSYGTSWLTALGSVGPLELDLTPVEIDERLARAIDGALSLYDGLTHRHMFTLPKDIRTALEGPWTPIDAHSPLLFDVELDRGEGPRFWPDIPSNDGTNATACRRKSER